MSYSISKVSNISSDASLIYIVSDLSQLDSKELSEKEWSYIKKKVEADKKQKFFFLNRLDQMVAIIVSDASIKKADHIEKIRREGAAVWQKMKAEESYLLSIVNLTNNPEVTLACAEGIVLNSYTFTKYKTEGVKSTPLQLFLYDELVTEAQVSELNYLCESVFISRDLVNEPVGTLTAVRLGEIVQELSAKYGFKAEVYGKAKIEALKMGGLLGVNQGSIDPPTFSILEWKPENAVNKEPYVLVGKGVVFDTGGVNLKTPAGSMDTMKCDMGGAAAVVGALSAIAMNKLPVYVIGLIPATDNRLNGNTIVPGDVLTMYSGKTVEVMNTDAEGRLILGDALSFSEKYNPQLVIDLATLTGNAAIALGAHGTVGMGTASEEVMSKLAKAGEEVCERIVWFPFWSEYDDLIKSEVADIKNVGGRDGGAITAGKFLAHFVKSPWLHLDIAGPAFITSSDSYRPVGGTAVGVRMLYQFFKNTTTL